MAPWYLMIHHDTMVRSRCTASLTKPEWWDTTKIPGYRCNLDKTPYKRIRTLSIDHWFVTTIALIRQLPSTFPPCPRSWKNRNVSGSNAAPVAKSSRLGEVKIIPRWFLFSGSLVGAWILSGNCYVPESWFCKDCFFRVPPLQCHRIGAMIW